MSDELDSGFNDGYSTGYETGYLAAQDYYKQEMLELEVKVQNYKNAIESARDQARTLEYDLGNAL